MTLKCTKVKSYVLVTLCFISFVLYYKTNKTTILSMNKFLSSAEFQSNITSFVSVLENNKEIQLDNLKPCPKTSPYLIGDFVFHHFNGNLSDIEKLHDEPWKPGGRFKPKTCIPEQKVAIIIAYRDRKKHLLDFLYHTLPMLKRQQLDFTIFVVEQAGKEVFNRGLVMNVGVLESLKIDNYTCFIFHDVDMYPIHDFNLYQCEDKPKHMAVALEKSHFKLRYEGYFGGVTALNKTHVELTNGFSNSFFGWGGEDGNHRDRIAAKGLKYVRYPLRYSRYATPGHRRDKSNPTNPERFQMMQNTKSRMAFDGLNSAAYNVTSITYLKLYTNITIVTNRYEVFKKINETKVIVEKAKEQEKEKLKQQKTQEGQKENQKEEKQHKKSKEQSSNKPKKRSKPVQKTRSVDKQQDVHIKKDNKYQTVQHNQKEN